MTIQQLVDRLQEISLNHKDIKSFHVGNTWDQSSTKGDIYPAVWVEFPVLVTYELKNQKKYTFSFDVLALPKPDDTTDEMNMISHCEQIADQLLQAFQWKIANINIGALSGLTVKNINADIACGVRVDLEFYTNRECDYLNYFNEAMEKL
jgi:hypothetical protein